MGESARDALAAALHRLKGAAPEQLGDERMCLCHDEADAILGQGGFGEWLRPPAGTRLVLMSDDLFRELGATSVEWGEPDGHGWYTPTVHRAEAERLGQR